MNARERKYPPGAPAGKETPRVLDEIPFSLDLESLLAEARLDPSSDDAGEMAGLAGLAGRVGRPKAVYSVSFVERRAGDTVRIGGVEFTSRALARNLASVERVFPLLATCGHEMDEAFPAPGDMLRGFWWELIKARLLEAANRHLEAHLRRRFRLGRTARMLPGSADVSIWPIEQQRQLFALLGAGPGAIGVTLTASCLMVPNKSVSGILFPAENDFRGCEVCRRSGCRSRRAAFDPRLWEEVSAAGA